MAPRISWRRVCAGALALLFAWCAPSCLANGWAHVEREDVGQISYSTGSWPIDENARHEDEVFVCAGREVLVLDASSGIPIGRIPLLDDPWDLVSCQGKLYVTYMGHIDDGVVTVISCSTRQIVKAIDIGMPISQLVAVGDTVYGLCSYDDAVAVVDARDDVVIATITVGENPVAMAVVGETIVVSNCQSNTLSLIDTETNAVSGEIATPAGPFRMAVDRSNALVCCAVADTVVYVDIDQRLIVAEVPVGRMPTSILLHDGYAYVGSHLDRSISVMDTPSRRVVSTVSMPSEAVDLDALSILGNAVVAWHGHTAYEVRLDEEPIGRSWDASPFGYCNRTSYGMYTYRQCCSDGAWFRLSIQQTGLTDKPGDSQVDDVLAGAGGQQIPPQVVRVIMESAPNAHLAFSGYLGTAFKEVQDEISCRFEWWNVNEDLFCGGFVTSTADRMVFDTRHYIEGASTDLHDLAQLSPFLSRAVLIPDGDVTNYGACLDVFSPSQPEGTSHSVASAPMRITITSWGGGDALHIEHVNRAEMLRPGDEYPLDVVDGVLSASPLPGTQLLDLSRADYMDLSIRQIHALLGREPSFQSSVGTLTYVVTSHSDDMLVYALADPSLAELRSRCSLSVLLAPSVCVGFGYRATGDGTAYAAMLRRVVDDMFVLRADLLAMELGDERLANREPLVTDADADGFLDPDGESQAEPSIKELSTALRTVAEVMDYDPEYPLSDSASDVSVTAWRADIIPGDILLCRTPGSPFHLVPGMDVLMDWTHCGLYVGRGRVVEAVASGVVVTDLEDWDHPGKEAVRAIRVTVASSEARRIAAKFALGQIGCLYDFNYSTKSIDPRHTGIRTFERELGAWYCSELVWAAYKSAGEELGIDLDFDPGPGPVTPDELAAIVGNSIGSVIGEHIETWEVPALASAAFAFLVMSPIDIEITDPDGLSISRSSSSIPGARYIEEDLDQDGHSRVVVAFPKRKHGDYQVTPIAKAGASPDAVYRIASFDYVAKRTRDVVGTTAVSEIPEEPYHIKSRSYGSPILPVVVAVVTGGAIALLVVAFVIRRRRRKRTILLS
ncbi:YiiX/YebB-like N1pC/P60 family cysteine hydrolase [Candidatus Bipolaricaulota bacterium]